MSLLKIVNKGALAERGFDSQSMRDLDFVRDVIEKQKWGELCKVEHSYKITLVRTFYVEACTTKGNTIWVRGVPVNFDIEAINSFFGL